MNTELNIPEENIKSKFSVIASNSALSISENGCVTVDTTEIFKVHPFTYNNISIYHLNNNKFLISAIRQRVWGAAELLARLEQTTSMSEKAIIKTLSDLGIHESDYFIREYEDDFDGFFSQIDQGYGGIILFTPKFKKQKLVSEHKSKIYTECSHYSIITNDNFEDIIEKK